jgi:hypothetical protein
MSCCSFPRKSSSSTCTSLANRSYSHMQDPPQAERRGAAVRWRSSKNLQRLSISGKKTSCQWEWLRILKWRYVSTI